MQKRNSKIYDLIQERFAGSKDSVGYIECGGYRLVNLGLPSGTLWMDRNIGADDVTDEGDYFAWGEVYTKQQYSIQSYDITKHIESGYITKDDDVVYQVTDGECRIPTKEEAMELVYNTNVEKCVVDGVLGAKFKSLGDDNVFVFMPVTGMRMDDIVYKDDFIAIWLSTSNNGMSDSLIAMDLFRQFPSGTQFDRITPETQPEVFAVKSMNTSSVGLTVRGVKGK